MRVVVAFALAACGPRAVPATAPPDSGWCAHEVVVVPKSCPERPGLIQTREPLCSIPTAMVCGLRIGQGTVYACRRGNSVEKVEARAPAWRLAGPCLENRAEGVWTEYQDERPHITYRYANGELLGTSGVE